MSFARAVHPRVRSFLLGSLLGAVFTASAQAPLPIYTDRLVNGFQDWSWGTRDFANPTPVHTGTNSIRASLNTWEAVSLYHSDLDTRLYASFDFWANGGTNGGQRLQLYVQYGTNSGPNYLLAALPTNAWRRFSVPLSSLGATSLTNLNRINLQLHNSGRTGTFYLDDVQLAVKAAPALVNVSVNTAQKIRTADTRWFGVNTAIWDKEFQDDIPLTTSLLREMGVTTLRFPGGSASDEYHWYSNKSGTNTWEWWLSFAEFTRAATNLGAGVFITVNYGTGTANEAASWVRHANVTNHLGFQYWEIGNENYGSWETDSNTYPHDPYTYAVRATNYIARMKAADPTIKIGIVVAAGENSFSNVYCLNHPAINPRTGQTNYGWTPILLATLKSLGVTPDFAAHHFYPAHTAQESDPLLMQASVNWARDAADLRQQIADYFGAGGTGIELLVTENNSNAGDQGRQSTSLVNGLYYADSLGELMKTEFNGFIWWDLRNATDTNGLFDDLLYGWRTYGDLGVINGSTNRHPTFYAAKLMTSFTRPGDAILEASSDYPLLSAFASRLASGAVTLLVINKDAATNFNARLRLDGFVPDATAQVRSYGIPQDEAARTNAPLPAQDIAQAELAGAGTNFTASFPPLSLTLFTFAPAAPRLQAVPSGIGAVALQLQGQPDVRYVLQSASNLIAANWISVSTNTLTGSTLNFAIPIPPGSSRQFWRAVWQP
jgi:alpha-N-arabinofuranosidase